MPIAALVTWIITALIGSFMLIRWVSRGGLRRQGAGATHFAPARVFTHFGLAAAGLILWISYLVTGSSVLAWIAFGALVPVALLGGLLVRRWVQDGRAAMRGDTPPDGIELAEQHIPRAPVVLHGIFAVSTFVLVLLSALGAG
jgi:hypothetical protein